MSKWSLLIGIANVLLVADAGPYLFNAIMTFSRMNLSGPITDNIGDLRHAKSEHPGKLFLKEHDENVPRNEVTPTIFQKTVTKILQKLQFLAQLANAGSFDTKTNSSVGGVVETEPEKFDLTNGIANSTEEVESGRFSLTKVFESVVDLVSNIG